MVGLVTRSYFHGISAAVFALHFMILTIGMDEQICEHTLHSMPVLETNDSWRIVWDPKPTPHCQIGS